MDNLASLINFNLENESIKIGSYIIEKQSIYDLLSVVIKVIIILLCMYLVVKIGSAIINRYISKQKNFKFSLDEKKANTIGAILKSALRYSVYFIGVASLVETVLGVNKIWLTFAGIGGVAVGFASQSFIKDVINGFFILFEDQFAVGEYISIGNMDGIVENMELRVTKIRDFNGELHIVSNSLITKVTNHSRGDIKITVDVDIAYDEDIDRTIDVISKLCKSFKEENDNVTEGPEVLGVNAFKEGGVTIRVVGKTKPMTQWDTEMKLRKEIREVLKGENINIPYPKVRLVKE